jgi:fucose permease
MSENSNPLSSVGAGISLGLAIAALVVSLGVQPEAIELNEKFKYIFASLFLGTSIGHFLGEALVSEGENKKYALLGLFTTLGLLFVVFLVYGQGFTIFAGAIGGMLAFFTTCLILGHHARIIDDSDRLDQLVGEFAAKVSPGGLAFIISSFIADTAFSQEAADAMSQVAIYASAGIIAFYVLKYREVIWAEIEPLVEEITASGEGRNRDR